jgi:hypothetical protein
MSRSNRFSVSVGIKINVAWCLLALAELVKVLMMM